MKKLEFLSDLANGKCNVNTLVESMEEQRTEIKKHIHLAKVVAFAYKVEELINSKVFEKHEMESMELFYDYDYDIGNIPKCIFNHTEDHDYSINKKPKNTPDPYDLLREDIDSFCGFSNSFVADNFHPNEGFEIKLDENVKENIFKIMLSKELITLLEYNQLDNSLPSNENKAKKPKL